MDKQQNPPINITVSIPSEQIAEMINTAIIQAVAGRLPLPPDVLLLTVKEVAQRCGYGQDSVRDWIKNGRTVPGRVGRPVVVKLKVVTRLSEGEKRYSMRIRPSTLKEFLDHFADETL